MRSVTLLAAVWSFAFLLSACGASQKAETGLVDDRLRPCPGSPNCVSSMATDAAQKVGPFPLQVPPDDAWAAAKKAILQQPRTQIVASTENYLHAECRSAVFGFVDDLELQLLPEQQELALRSAARSGYYDFGVNRKRAEDLHRQLQAVGAVR